MIKVYLAKEGSYTFILIIMNLVLLKLLSSSCSQSYKMTTTESLALQGGERVIYC